MNMKRDLAAAAASTANAGLRNLLIDARDTIAALETQLDLSRRQEYRMQQELASLRGDLFRIRSDPPQTSANEKAVRPPFSTCLLGPSMAPKPESP